MPAKTGRMKPCLKCGVEFWCSPCRDVGRLEKKYCSLACYRGGFTPERRKAAFWKKVDQSAGPDACWPWQGAITSHGYGCFSAGGGRVKGSHKVAYEFSKGPVPAGLQIMHTCDNRPCCNPAHMGLGTLQANMADCHAKGRNVRGEKSWSAKLTDDQVREIRRTFKRISHRKSNIPQLARDYGVSIATVSAIVRGSIWRHVT